VPSSPIQRLSEKIQLAASTISTLRKERERLEAEVSLMQEESRRARKLLKDHQKLLADRERMKTRLERLLKKLNALRV
jgi:chromosome segregation ATPase